MVPRNQLREFAKIWVLWMRITGYGHQGIKDEYVWKMKVQNGSRNISLFLLVIPCVEVLSSAFAAMDQPTAGASE